MRTTHLMVWLTAAMSFVVTSIAAQEKDRSVRPLVREGEFLITFKDTVAASAVATMAQGLAPLDNNQAKILASFPELRTICIKLPADGPAMQDFRRAAAMHPDVESIEPNYVFYLDAQETKPNDGELDRCWHLPKINAFTGWTTRKDSPDVIVAIIDTGVLLSHPDLQANLWVNGGEIPGNGKDDDGNYYIDDVNGHDFATGTFPDNFPTSPALAAPPIAEPEPIVVFGLRTGLNEYQKHASHVAGTIAAVGNNGQGVVGVTWKTQLMILKFFGGPDGGGDTADAIRAINYAIANGADIINASWGGGQRSVALERAIERAAAAGVLFVAAAGNGGIDGRGDNNDRTPFFPASYAAPNILAVAATGTHDRATDFSNFGVESVDVAAPGADIYSTVPGGSWRDGEAVPPPVAGYELMSGTSMATPVVSGLAALIKAQNPSFDAVQIKRLIELTADPIADLSGIVATGGRINVDRALSPTVVPAQTNIPSLATGDDARLQELLNRMSPSAKTSTLLQNNRVRPDQLKTLIQKGLENRSSAASKSQKLLVGILQPNGLSMQSVVQSAVQAKDKDAKVLSVKEFAAGEYEVEVQTKTPHQELIRDIEKLPRVKYAESASKQTLQPK